MCRQSRRLSLFFGTIMVLLSRDVDGFRVDRSGGKEAGDEGTDGDDQRRAYRGDRRGVAPTARRSGGPGEGRSRVRRACPGVRLANAEAFLKAKYGRTTSFYPDGLLDTHGHCRLEADSDRLGT